MSLDREHYDLRGRDGHVVCSVGRDRAEQAIASGALELWRGPAGAYLRSPEARYPDEARPASVGPDSRHTLHGMVPASAANAGALYRHNRHGCATWTQPDEEAAERAGGRSRAGDVAARTPTSSPITDP